MAGELDVQDVSNILSIMSRVEIKGTEAHAYVTAEMKLKMLLQSLQQAAAAAATAGDTKNDGDDGSDGVSGEP